MLKITTVLIFIVLSLVLTIPVNGCVKPPTDLQYNAQQAVDSAIVDQADVYAKTMYEKAVSDLSAGNVSLVVYHYQEAAMRFQNAIDAAHLASTMAKRNKNTISESPNKEGSTCNCRNCIH